ncbi:MAG: formylglycine-generating enzyme family protein [Candidatus Brocadiia bacterium]
MIAKRGLVWLLVFASVGALVLGYAGIASRKFSIEKAPIALVRVAGGSFRMGSTKLFSWQIPLHEVVVAGAFYVGASEVSQAEYGAVMGSNPSKFKGETRPVENVTWEEADEFCRRLTAAEQGKGNLPRGMVYRLPTEVEWEYCCRAGSSAKYCFGDDQALLGDYASFLGSSKGTTSGVFARKPNAWGAYEMHGNVREWCQDFWADGAYWEREGSASLSGPLTGCWKVIRGGSWQLDFDLCQSAARFKGSPDGWRSEDVGFRVVVGPETPLRPFRACLKSPPASVVIGDLVRNAPFPIVAVPPGTFSMGSSSGHSDESPVRTVTISRPFCIGVTEITQAQYRSVTNENRSDVVGPDMPAVNVSWSNAVDFCKALTRMEREIGHLPEGMEYRLPTEAEWEYCCRSGSTGAFSFGDDPGMLGDYAWFCGNMGNTQSPVGKKKPNAWGIFDMHGSVAEWCYDWYGPYSVSPGVTIDPVGPAEGEQRVFRGGSWGMDADRCRCACREQEWPNFIFESNGFRVVLAPILRMP